MKKVAIIGGGISGLSAAYSFKKRASQEKNFDYVLLEKLNRIGGTIITERVNGFLVEGGPDCFVSTKPQVIELANELGIGNRLLNSNEEKKGTFILSRGKLHELPEGLMTMVPSQLGPFLKTKLISWPGKLRIALDLVIPPKRTSNEESLSEFVRRRLGREVLEKIAEPLVGGVHAGDPDKMSLKSTFPRFIEMEEEYGSLIRGTLAMLKKAKETSGKTPSDLLKRPPRTFFMSLHEGMQELTDTLLNGLDRDKVLTGNEVQRIVWDKKKNRFEISVGQGESFMADTVIVAVPAFAAARMVRELDELLAQKLSEIPYVDSATISLGFKNENLGVCPQGFGVVIPLAEKKRLMAATWSSNKWAFRAGEGFFLARGFVGGARNQEYVRLDDQSLLKLVQEELKGIAGINGQPEVVRIFRWGKGMAQYTVGHSQRVAEIETRASARPGFFLAGNAYHGVGLSDCIKSGKEAANAAFDFLNTRPANC